MNEKQYHHGDLKASLIEAANIVLVRDGATRLSLRGIAAEVGVSHMAPYAHFKNKNELIKSVIESGFQQMENAMLDCQKKLTPSNPNLAGELILAYGVSYIEFALANPQLYRLMIGESHQSPIVHSQNKNETEIAEKPILGINSDKEYTKRINRPFDLLRDAFAMKVNEPLIAKTQALGAWSMVHGLSALLTEGSIQIPESMSLKQFLATASSMSFNAEPSQENK
ncbi:TetR/AcrR family transcriptional regulator [Shewanella electrodiphila]|uniref:TetR/AcrR family transcriptional regulator n=1 Tax=Shewanella electrodiphila TaxID=934143 RepID=A0ABT0KMN4_9GAMM|nr:TetR/AcrR family transcriptional regulator [Shewanella electrodiphila]MCL1045106.1 TetR/AcrR family transcriptional regulator [Shewanella electrodiphila]